MTAGSYTCRRCHRALKDPKSVAAGMGKICASKQTMGNNQMDMINDPVMLPGEPTAMVVIKRLPDGKIATNVPRVIVCHSPTGFEIGYGGSGPADFALNILHWFLPPLGDGIKATNGATYSKRAYLLHQQFKRDFLQKPLEPDETISIGGDEITEWIKLHG